MNAKHRPFLLYLPLFFGLQWFLVKSGLFQQIFWLNQGQSIALAILIIAAVLWITEWVPLYITSFVILLLQLIWLVPEIAPQGGAAVRMPYLAPFFNEIILLFLGGFVLAAALHKYGLDRKIASSLLKKTGNNPAKAMFGFMATSAFLSMWMSNTATTAMMFAILLPVVQKIPPENPFAKALAISIPFSCNLGGLGTPIGTPPNAIAIAYLNSHGYHIGFANWMLATLPFMLLFLVFLWLLLLKLFPAGNLVLELPEDQQKQMTLIQKTVALIFFLTLVLWFGSDYLSLSIGTLSLVPIVVLFGAGILDLSDFKQLPWDVLFMVGGGICLGVGIQQSGLTDKIITLIPTHSQFWVILSLFAILATIMTTFMSNTATANLLIPLAVSLDQNLGLLVIAIALNCSTAMSLPVSTPPNAIAFGSGMLASKDMLRPGIAITVFALFTTLIAGALYWPLINLNP